MNTQVKTPAWAKRIVDEVWVSQRGPWPTITWTIGKTARRRTYTSGWCKYWTNEIQIHAGEDSPRWEQKMVLLHELAHAISPGGHDERFWRTFWTLVRRFNLPIAKCRTRSSDRGDSRRMRIATGRSEEELCPRAQKPRALMFA